MSVDQLITEAFDFAPPRGIKIESAEDARKLAALITFTRAKTAALYAKEPDMTTKLSEEQKLPEPFGYVMYWPKPGGGQELIFSRTDAAGKAIGCVVRPVWVDYQMRDFALSATSARYAKEQE